MKVKVKSWEEIEKTLNEGNYNIENVYFDNDMRDYCGKEIEVVSWKYKNNIIFYQQRNSHYWNWASEWLDFEYEKPIKSTPTESDESDESDESNESEENENCYPEWFKKQGKRLAKDYSDLRIYQMAKDAWDMAAITNNDLYPSSKNFIKKYADEPEDRPKDWLDSDDLLEKMRELKVLIPETERQKKIFENFKQIIRDNYKSKE